MGPNVVRNSVMNNTSEMISYTEIKKYILKKQWGSTTFNFLGFGWILCGMLQKSGGCNEN